MLIIGYEKVRNMGFKSVPLVLLQSFMKHNEVTFQHLTSVPLRPHKG